MASAQEFSHLVVIGSSAGGIEALSALVTTLPKDFAAPIVIAQHLEPTRPSHLAEILARRTPLPVRTLVESSAQKLAPGVIYVVPSNRDVQITDSEIDLHKREDGARTPLPSVDLLLSSAAEVYGDRLIAVILSGTGSDGAAGARVVKKGGGTVIIQNPETAPYPGMPLSLAPTTVDIVANADRIGGILSDLLNGMPVPTQPEERRVLEAFLDEVRSRFDIDFNSYKTPTILRRLQRRIVATDSRNLTGYRAYLARHPEEWQQLVNAFLIKVTDFFRDPELYDYLRQQVLPHLIEYARRHGNELRIWSAGCATGEETYSLASLLAERLGAELEQFSVRIFGTDLDNDAIAFARRGIYPPAALTHMPKDLVAKYFARTEGSAYQIAKRVRTLTVFGQHDLAQRAPFPHVDMVVCRNVLIYFTPVLQLRTLQLFAYSLRDGGYLVLGKAESSGALSDFFELLDKTQKVFRRHGDRLLMPPPQVRDSLSTSSHRLAPPRTPSSAIARGVKPGRTDAARGLALHESALLNLPIGVVVVDRHYDIQSINGVARRYFGIHGQAVGDDLIHLARGIPHAHLRAAIDAAFHDGTATILDDFAVEQITSEHPLFLQVGVYPQRSISEEGPIETALILAHDVTALVLAQREMSQRSQGLSTELGQVRERAQTEAAARDELIGRLVETNRQLLEANQELTGTNEDLRAANEELLLSTEEAQAATEEVETLNEELQATNEELETLNEELQATIEELNTTNDDLHARSMELQELARSSEQERARLEAILTSMGDAVVVVDHAGNPVMTNAEYERLLASVGGQFAPRDNDGQPLPPASWPQQRAARGESFNMQFTLAAPDGTIRWFEANGAPVREGEHREPGLQGGVIIIHDVSERSLQRLQEEFTARVSHELRTPLTPLRAYLQMLLQHLALKPENERARGYAERALAQMQQLTRLVDDLMDVTRLQSGKYAIRLEPVRLDELVSHAVEVGRMLVTAGNAQSITLAVADAPLVVRGDPGRLDQVMLNLLTNAIEHGGSGKRIEVRLRRVGDEAELQVQDYGAGIPPADLPNIFSRFYQAAVAGQPQEGSHHGLGLGLHIAHEIVVAHQGTISVASTPGKGTTFTVRLPLAPGSAGPSTEPSAQSGGRGKPGGKRGR